MGQQNKFDCLLVRINKFVIRFLMGLLTFCLGIGTVDLLIIMVKNILTSPHMFGEFNTIYNTFELIVIIIIGFELFKALHIVVCSDSIPSIPIIQIAIIAVANKIIASDYKDVDPQILYGLSTLMIALGIAHFFMKYRNFDNKN